MQLLKDSFSTKFPAMLTKLWQLGSHDLNEADKSALTLTVLSRETFAHNMLSGVVAFSNDLSAFLEADYLTGNDAELIRCYVRARTSSSLFQQE